MPASRMAMLSSPPQEEVLVSFDEAWTVVAVSRDGEAVSPRLRPLLQAVYRDCLSEPLKLVSLKSSLENLLQFLSRDGRTNANCWAADLFFADCQGWERGWADPGWPSRSSQFSPDANSESPAYAKKLRRGSLPSLRERRLVGLD